MLPKRAPPLMRPVMKMVSNQLLDAMINPQLKLPAYLSLQVSAKFHAIFLSRSARSPTRCSRTNA